MARPVVLAVVVLVAGCVVLMAGFATSVGAVPEGDVTWAVHVSLAPTWFDPAETPAVITPFMMLFAMHDALVKPMPGNPMAPSLAESWSMSRDGLVYEFVLRMWTEEEKGRRSSGARFRRTALYAARARINGWILESVFTAGPPIT